VTTGYRCLRRVSLSDGEIASISPLEPYEAEGQGQDFVNRHWFVSGRQGRMYRLRDGNLWRFRQKSLNPDAGFAWAEARPAEDIGLEWAFSVPAGDLGSRYDLRANFACRGRWALQVRQGDEILAERRGRGRGNYQVEGMRVRVQRPGLHTLRFFQPAGQPLVVCRASYYAFASRTDYDPALHHLAEPALLKS